MTRCYLQLALLTLPVIGAPALQAQEMLKWKFSRDEALNYKVTQTVRTSRMVADQELATAMDQQMDMSWVVRDLAADGSLVVLNQTVKRFQMKMNNGLGEPQTYDSANPVVSDNPFISRLSDVFGGIVNQPFEVHMAQSGKVSKVVVPQALVDTINQNSGGLTTRTLQDMMKQSAVTLPTDPVQPGSKWFNEQQVKMAFGTMKVRSKMTYTGRDRDGNIDISVVPVVSVTPSEGNGPRLSLSSSEGNGRISFNNQTGRVVKSVLNLTMDMATQVGDEVTSNTVRQTTIMELVP